MNRYYGNIGDVWKHLVLAELLGLEPGAVDVSLHRARSRLRAALGEAERV